MYEGIKILENFMNPHSHYKRKYFNGVIEFSIIGGYIKYNLLCICGHSIPFEFLKYNDYEIHCDKCKKLSFRLICHDKEHITIRRYLSKNKYKDYKLKNDPKELAKFKAILQHEILHIHFWNFML
jgi:hypothetical protein